MKVKNLYVADIRMIQHFKTTSLLGQHITLTTKSMRKTIVYKNPNEDKARDIFLRKKYDIGLQHNSYHSHGEEYIDYLNPYAIRKILQDSGYNKPNITKRKLLKLIDANSKVGTL